ncbi:MAG TPA: cytochrome c [Polyangia bacterium]|nr:cytochrome c [Polyangia bacterium]
MTAGRNSSVLALLIATLGVFSASCIDENILDVMADRQPRAGRYKESAFFEDGLSMHAAPEGTVPRERITQNVPLTTGRLPDGPVQLNGEPLPVYVKSVPLPVTASLLALGRKRFDITCGTCHGPAGDGVSIVATQMSLHPPPSLITPNYIAKPTGYFFEVATKGFGMMASYAAELTVEERWAVVAYIRALQLAQSQTVDQLPPAVRAQLEALPATGTKEHP